MNKVQTIFKKYIKEEIISIDYIDKGITNDNYKIVTTDNCYVLRIPKKENIGFNRKNEKEIIKLIENKNIDVETLYYNSSNGIKITKYVNEISSEINLDLFIKKLKFFHNLQSNKISRFDVFDLLTLYKKSVNDKNYIFNKEKQVVNNVKELYTKYPLILCHNDLLLSNILQTDNDLFIIDYEYSGLNIALFDLASFINENNIQNELITQKILKLYFENSFNNAIYEDFKLMYRFLDILWGYWAMMMYEKYHQEVYLNIAMLKNKRYHKSF